MHATASKMPNANAISFTSINWVKNPRQTNKRTDRQIEIQDRKEELLKGKKLPFSQVLFDGTVSIFHG